MWKKSKRRLAVVDQKNEEVEKSNLIQGYTPENYTQEDTEIVQLMLEHGHSPKEISVRINKDVITIYRIIHTIRKTETTWEREKDDLESLSELKWLHAKYMELLEVYKIVNSNIHRYRNDVISGANLASLYINIYDRLIETAEMFREEKQRLDYVSDEKYLPIGNQEFQKMMNEIALDEIGEQKEI
jgi:hypothetical protein